jgi:hypothetical protein
MRERMIEPDAQSECLVRAATPSMLFGEAQAHADRIHRARMHVGNCITMAVVTSPGISAELIDLAIEYTRSM